MKIPQGMTEKQTMGAIKKVLDILAPSMTFGYYTIEDIWQEGYLIALKVLRDEKYNDEMNPGVKSREERFMRFLSVHIKNRLLNLKRDKYYRWEKPKDENNMEQWETKNQYRRSLMHPQDITTVADEELYDKHRFGDELDYQELLGKIRNEVSADIWNDFQRMLAGVTISEARKEAVQDTLRDFINGPETEV